MKNKLHYDKGVYSTITSTWNNAKKVLTINDRKGTFPGMMAERKFNIICVAKNRGLGLDVAEKFDKEVTYTGKKVVIKL